MNNKDVLLAFVFATVFAAGLAKRYATKAGVNEAFDMSLMGKRGLYNYDDNVGHQSIDLQRQLNSRDQDKKIKIKDEKKKRRDWLDYAAGDALLVGQDLQRQQKHQKPIQHMAVLKQDSKLDDGVADGDAVDVEGDAVADADVDAEGYSDADADALSEADDDAGDDDYMQAEQSHKRRPLKKV